MFLTARDFGSRAGILGVAMMMEHSSAVATRLSGVKKAARVRVYQEGVAREVLPRDHRHKVDGQRKCRRGEDLLDALI